MRKINANQVNADTTAQLESGELQDLLRAKGTKKVNVMYQGERYGITDIVVDSGQAILLADKGDDGINAKYLAKELGDIGGMDVFVEIDGKLISAKDFTKGNVVATKATKKASQKASCTDHRLNVDDYSEDKPLDNNITIGEKSLTSKIETVMHSVLAKVTGINPLEATSVFSGKKSKDTYFDESDESFSGQPTIVAPSNREQGFTGYMSYNPKGDTIQIGMLDQEYEPITSTIRNGKLRDIAVLLKDASRIGIEFDDQDFDNFRSHVFEQSPRQASQKTVSAAYPMDEDKVSGLTSLEIGALKGRKVYLITSEDARESAEIEINWGGDVDDSAYEYVQIDDVVPEVKKLTGLTLNVKDKNLAKVVSRYGLDPKQLSETKAIDTSASNYKLDQGDISGASYLHIGEYKGDHVNLIVSEEVSESAEIEINWGSGYEYVNIDDVVPAVKKYTGIKLNKNDKNLAKLVNDFYGLDPKQLTEATIEASVSTTSGSIRNDIGLYLFENQALSHTPDGPIMGYKVRHDIDGDSSLNQEILEKHLKDKYFKSSPKSKTGRNGLRRYQDEDGNILKVYLVNNKKEVVETTSPDTPKGKKFAETIYKELEKMIEGSE